MAILTTTLMDFPKAMGSPILKLKAILKVIQKGLTREKGSPTPKLTDCPRAIQKGSPRVKEKRFRRCSGFRMRFRMARETPTRWWTDFPRAMEKRIRSWTAIRMEGWRG